MPIAVLPWVMAPTLAAADRARIVGATTIFSGENS
jgi:hypothetical protein